MMFGSIVSHGSIVGFWNAMPMRNCLTDASLPPTKTTPEDLPNKLPTEQVLTARDCDEWPVLIEKVEGEFRQTHDRLARRQRIQMQIGFLGADLRIDLTQSGKVEIVLAAEIVIDEARIAGRALRDLVNFRAIIAVRSEFRQSSLENLRFRTLRIT